MVEALKNITLSIQTGEFTALVGPSGSGKSTLLNIIGCLDEASQGTIIFDKENVTSKSQNELAMIRNNKIGFIFQTFNLFPIFDVYENIEFPFLAGNGNNKSHGFNKQVQRFGYNEDKGDKALWEKNISTCQRKSGT
jgi:ABC-type lipoprotein export system ATPase subunit